MNLEERIKHFNNCDFKVCFEKNLEESFNKLGIAELELKPPDESKSLLDTEIRNQISELKSLEDFILKMSKNKEKKDYYLARLHEINKKIIELRMLF